MSHVEIRVEPHRRAATACVPLGHLEAAEVDACVVPARMAHIYAEAAS